MEFLKPRIVKARQQTLALLAPCLGPVQDDLGNVPVAMQQDPYVNGAIIGLTERICASLGLTRPTPVNRVVSAVFEDIYRREAIAVLTRCDALLEDPGSDLSQARADLGARTPAEPGPDWTQALCAHIRAHYDRPDTLVL